MAFPSERAGTARTMMATLFAWSIAAPTAWSARNPHRAAKARGEATEHRAER